MTEYVQLNSRLAEIDAERAALLEQLQAQAEKARADVLAAVAAHIQSHGFSVEQIALELLPEATRKLLTKATAPKKARKVSTVAQRKQATVYVCRHTGNTYSKGRVPEWLKEQMAARGVTDVASYKAEHMVVQGQSGDQNEAEETTGLPQAPSAPPAPPAE